MYTYTPYFDSALSKLCAEEMFAADYLTYVSWILHKKHYGKTRKYRR